MKVRLIDEIFQVPEGASPEETLANIPDEWDTETVETFEEIVADD